MKSEDTEKEAITTLEDSNTNLSGLYVFVGVAGPNRVYVCGGGLSIIHRREEKAGFVFGCQY